MLFLKRRLILRWFWLIGLCVLAACTQQVTPEPSPTPQVQPTRVATDTPLPPSATPTPVPQVLRLNLRSELDTIDPQKALFPDELGVIMMVFGNLLSFDANGQLIPDMAADMPKLSPDGLSYSVQLRPGLRYSDGKPLSAKDFEYAWKRQLDPEIASDYAFIGYVIAGGEEYNKADLTKVSKEELKKLRDAVGVKAADDQTLEFKLKERAPYFLSILATWNGVPTRQEMVEKGGDKWTEPATYIGNGPYILKDWTHQVKMAFVANANYYRGKPPLERIEQFIIGDPSAALVAYINGELDVVSVGAGELAQVQNDPRLKAQHVVQPGPCTTYFGFNTTRKPFDNVKVRRAFAQAIDRASYVKNIAKGLSLPADQFLPPGFPGHYDDLKTLKFDPAAAKKELAEAGYPNGKGLPEIKYGYAASAPNQARGEWLQTQLKDNLGVEIKLDPADPRTYADSLKTAATTPQLYIYGWCQDYPDPQDWYSTVFHSSSTLSLTRWKNEPFDRLTRAADTEPDLQKRHSLYKQAAQILIDESPIVFVLYTVHSFLVKPWVTGVKLTPLDYYFASSAIMNLKIVPR